MEGMQFDDTEIHAQGLQTFGVAAPDTIYAGRRDAVRLATGNQAVPYFTLGDVPPGCGTIRRGDILLADDANPPAPTHHMMGASRLSAFVSVAGLDVDLPRGYTMKSRVLHKGNDVVKGEDKSEVQAKALRDRLKRLSFVGISLSKWEPGALDQSGAGVAAAFTGTLSILNTYQWGAVAVGDILCLRFPDADDPTSHGRWLRRGYDDADDHTVVPHWASRALLDKYDPEQVYGDATTQATYTASARRAFLGRLDAAVGEFAEGNELLTNSAKEPGSMSKLKDALDKEMEDKAEKPLAVSADDAAFLVVAVLLEMHQRIAETLAPLKTAAKVTTQYEARVKAFGIQVAAVGAKMEEKAALRTAGSLYTIYQSEITYVNARAPLASKDRVDIATGHSLTEVTKGLNETAFEMESLPAEAKKSGDVEMKHARHTMLEILREVRDDQARGRVAPADYRPVTAEKLWWRMPLFEVMRGAPQGMLCDVKILR